MALLRETMAFPSSIAVLILKEVVKGKLELMTVTAIRQGLAKLRILKSNWNRNKKELFERRNSSRDDDGICVGALKGQSASWERVERDLWIEHETEIEPWDNAKFGLAIRLKKITTEWIKWPPWILQFVLETAQGWTRRCKVMAKWFHSLLVLYKTFVNVQTIIPVNTNYLISVNTFLDFLESQKVMNNIHSFIITFISNGYWQTVWTNKKGCTQNLSSSRSRFFHEERGLKTVMWLFFPQNIPTKKLPINNCNL